METKDNEIEIAKLRVKQELGVSRWVALALYSLVSCTTGLIHGGFSEWQPIIYKTGAFSYLCSERDNKFFVVNSNLSYKTCDARDATVNDLSTISYFIQFGSCPLNGYILDKFGYKFCFLYGQTLILIAFSILAIFGNYSYAWYVFFILLGISTDPANMALLSVSKYFPENESLVFGIIGAARSMNFGFSLLLKTLFFYGPPLAGNQFYILCLGSIFTVVLYAFIIGIFFMARKSKLVDSAVQKANKNEKLSISDSKSSDNNSLDNNENKIKDVETGVGQPKGKRGYFKNTWNALWTHPQKWEYIIVVFICCVSAMRYDYYIKTNRSFFIYRGHDMTTIFSVALILSFIPAPLFGYLSDKYGPLSVLTVNNFFLFTSYILLFLKPVFFRYASIVVYFLYYAFSFSSYFCYINKRFPKRHFGKLMGFMYIMCAGFLLCNFYLTYLTEVVYSYKKEENFYPIAIGLTIAGAFVLALCFYLRRYRHITPGS